MHTTFLLYEDIALPLRDLQVLSVMEIFSELRDLSVGSFPTSAAVAMMHLANGKAGFMSGRGFIFFTMGKVVDGFYSLVRSTLTNIMRALVCIIGGELVMAVIMRRCNVILKSFFKGSLSGKSLNRFVFFLDGASWPD